MKVRAMFRFLGCSALALMLAAEGRADEQRQDFDCVMDPPLVVKVGSAVSGLLESVDVGRGDRVRAGQVIARINAAVERATLDLLAVRVASRAAIEAQEARLSFIEARLARVRQLFERGVATQDALDELEAERIASRSLLSQAEMDQALAVKELARAQTTLSIREIRSPVDGIVRERSLSAGEYLNQEAHVATIVQLDPLFVETFLPVDYYGLVALGDIGRVAPAPPIAGLHPATVTVIDSVFDAASSTFGVRLELPNPGGRLPGGHRCQVSFDFAAPR